MEKQNLTTVALLEGNELRYFDDIQLQDTLPDILRRAAFSAPDKGILFIADSGTEIWMNYSELYLEAQNGLANLQNRGVRPGDKLIIQVTDKREFLITYWACLLGGIIPAPLAATLSLDPNKATFEKLIYIWMLLDKPLIVTDYIPKHLQKALTDNDEQGVQQLLALGASNLRVILAESIQTEADEEAVLHTPNADDIAFLQFTSGSTGQPKGVMLSHANLIANMHSIVQGGGYGRDERAFSWMPFYHDMGLIGSHLAPLLALMSSYQMSSFSFIKRPVLWLEKIHQHRISITASPNFGYQRILEKVTDEQLQQLDLSCVQRIFNGAEPISVAVMNTFTTRLSTHAQLNPQAMCPVYGMAEACLGVSSTPEKETMRYIAVSRSCLSLSKTVEVIDKKDTDAVLFASEGKLLNGIQLRIVDDNEELLQVGQVGNIQIAGPNMTTGYYHNSEATAALLSGKWRRTGDLGFVLDGYLYITGRAKDIIFIGGQNFYAHDLEHIAMSIEGVGNVAIIGHQDQDTGLEQVVAFIAIDARYLRQKTDKEQAKQQLLAKIRDNINQYFGFSPDLIVVVKNNEIPRTTSGKIQRYRLLDDFKQGKFADRVIVASELLGTEAVVRTEAVSVPTREKLVDLIRQGWSEVLRLPAERIGLDDSFFQLGGTSIKAVEVIALAEAYTHCSIPQHAFTDFNTINGIVDYIIETEQSSRLSARVSSLLNTAKRKEDKSGVTLANSKESKPIMDKQAETTNNTDDIAIIGMSCRFPGAYNIRRFWEVLSEGHDCITEIPEDRWSIDDLYEPESVQENKSQSKWGGFIEDIRYFDAEFFNIHEDEAEQMDPQQRLFLEIAWLALENAGYAKTKNSHIGVFVGAGFNGYIENFINRFDVVNLHESTITGNLLNMVAARVSHTFNLTGPALTVDTACSSSLVAVHLARQSILRGECEMALAGGIQLNLTAAPYILFSQAGALSMDGHCHAFSEHANGFVPGEGAGAVVLKSYQKALADGDRIYAVIKGSAMNNDGHSLGIMAPNPQGQEQVIRQAYQNSQIDPKTVSYIEAHGVGTPISDMVEVKSLATVFNEAGTQHGQCALGSVKTNIGHLLSASGIAALIKTILAMEHQQIPASLHCREEKKTLRIDKTAFYINKQLKNWDSIYDKRRAAVHSFGFGGTNCHLILEEASKPETLDTSSSNLYQIVTFSAHHADAFAKEISNLRMYLRNHHEDTQLIDICYTQNAKRSHFWEYRAAFITNSVPHLRLLLSQFNCDSVKNNWTGKEILFAEQQQKPAKQQRAVVFMCSGEGSQFTQMGRVFYMMEPVFRDAIEECQKSLQQQAIAIDLCYLLTEAQEDERIYQTEIADLLIFVMDYALAKMWVNWGVMPEVLIGYGLGEYVALCLAGGISLEQGLALVYQRGKLLAARASNSLRIYAHQDAWQQMLTDNMLISAYHSDTDYVVTANDAQIIGQLQQQLEQANIDSAFLCNAHLPYANQHSIDMQGFQDIVANISFNPLSIPVMSSVSGELLTTIDGDYLLRHLQQAIQWQPMIEQLTAQHYVNFLEVGCGAQLAEITAVLLPTESWAGSTMPAHDWLRSMTIHRLKDRRNQKPDSEKVTYERRQQRDNTATDVPYHLYLQRKQRQHLIQHLGGLYVRGVNIDWENCFYRQCQPLENNQTLPKQQMSEESVTTPVNGRLINIPTYPFQRKVAWVKAQGEQQRGFKRQQQGLQQTGLGRYSITPGDHLFGTSVTAQCALLYQAYQDAYGNTPNLLEKIHFIREIDPQRAIDIIFLQGKSEFALLSENGNYPEASYTQGGIENIELLDTEPLRLSVLQQGMQVDNQNLVSSHAAVEQQQLFTTDSAILLHVTHQVDAECIFSTSLFSTALQCIAYIPQLAGYQLNISKIHKITHYHSLCMQSAWIYIELLEDETSRCHISIADELGQLSMYLESCYIQKQHKTVSTDSLPKTANSSYSLDDYLLLLAAKNLQCKPVDIDPEASFLDMGANSVMALNLVKELEQTLEVELSPTLLFEFPTLSALKDYLMATLPTDKQHININSDDMQVKEREERITHIDSPIAADMPHPTSSSIAATTAVSPIDTGMDDSKQQTLDILQATITQQRQDQMLLFEKQLEAIKTVAQQPPATMMRPAVQQLSKEDVLPVLQEYCAEQLGCSVEQINLTMSWMEQGGDSIQAIQIINKMAQQYGITLSKTLFFDYPSLMAVAHAIEQYVIH